MGSRLGEAQGHGPPSARYAAKDHPMVVSAGGVQMLGERKKWEQMEALTEVPSGLGQERNPKAVHISNYHY